MLTTPQFQGSTAHGALGLRFFQVVKPATFPQHIVRFRNDVWADKIGLSGLDDAQWARHFSHFDALDGSHPNPLALAYHGHQFQNYNPDLGDGRGFLFAQMIEPGTGRLLDFGTKGSGQTPWSRNGDGRLTLKGAVREIIATEMLCALGVDTSKTFSVIETGEALMRGDEPSPTRSAVMVRLSHGHLRIGSFQRHAHLEDPIALEILTRYGAVQYFTDLDSTAPMAELAVDFVKAVAENTARTAANWMAAGFVHGVLNTDNINITGESFDYGPWRFLPTLDADFTAAYFDEVGLYAYGKQPGAVAWNVARLAECFAAVAPVDQLARAVETYDIAYHKALNEALARRLGITAADGARIKLTSRLFPAMTAMQVPFEAVFFNCYGGQAGARRTNARDAYAQTALTGLVADLASCKPAPGARTGHAYFKGIKPCTALINEVEHIWQAIADDDDWSRLDAKVKSIRSMADAYGA